MKKLFTQIVKKNGELKDVYVCVDDETARVLEQVDEETRHTYLQEEYKMFMADYRYKRRNQSLEKSVDNGFDVIDEKQDVEEMAIKEADIRGVLLWVISQNIINLTQERNTCKSLQTIQRRYWNMQGRKSKFTPRRNQRTYWSS